MSERWVQDCKTIIDQIKKLEAAKDRDRLDMVRTMRFVLFAIQRSVSGWVEWVNNPDIMARFSLEELKEVSLNLAKLVEPFIEYDCEITSLAQRDSTTVEPETRNESNEKTKERTDTYYIR
jgi:hypothetical protein